MKYIVLALASIFSASVLAETYETTVDCADSGDFSCLHEEGRIEQEVDEQTDTKKSAKPKEGKKSLFNQAVEEKYDASSQLKQDAEHRVGAVYNVRVRYTLGKSAQTEYTANSVIQPMHRLMAKYCRKGWMKLQEWSDWIESDDYYLHYEFQCANR